MLASILSFVFVLWRFGKEQQWSAERENRCQPSHLLSSTDNGDVKLTAAYGGSIVSKTPGIGIFFDKTGDMVPIVFAQFVRKFSARQEIIIFFHMRPLSMPSIPESERFVIQRTLIPGCYRITVRHGYMDSIVSPDLGQLLLGQLTPFITRGNSSNTSLTEYPPAVQVELDALSSASESQLVYVMGKEEMKIKHGTNIFRRVLLVMFLWLRENSRTKMADVNIPTDSLVEMGFVKEI
ncbi:hypothetical protein V500_01483 [Pseudogymnoascus sp. VKM F-4518 (FW-2643)]|nr:hypothetical protein V500_01483 [Pseudogymnoascus sp. VKM F-4518 (FW-2643)]